MLAVDLLARALPAQQVQVVIDAMANEVVPTREGPLTRAALLAWARAHQEQSSLSAWAFATQPMPVVGVEETPTGDGEAPAANLEVSATCVVVSQQTPMTPLDLAARSLSDASMMRLFLLSLSLLLFTHDGNQSAKLWRWTLSWPTGTTRTLAS